jgi:hypothetical protein
MEPLKKIQVEGFAMFAEPELLFGNLDELCCVSHYNVLECYFTIIVKHSYSELEKYSLKPPFSSYRIWSVQRSDPSG